MKKFVVIISIVLLVIVVVVFLNIISWLQPVSISLSSSLYDNGEYAGNVIISNGGVVENNNLTFRVIDIVNTTTAATIVIKGPVSQPIDVVDPVVGIDSRLEEALPQTVIFPQQFDRFTINISLYGITDTYTIKHVGDDFVITRSWLNIFSAVNGPTAIPSFPANTVYAFCRFELTQPGDARSDIYCEQFFSALDERLKRIDGVRFQSQLTEEQETSGRWWYHEDDLSSIEDSVEEFQNPAYDLYITNGQKVIAVWSDWKAATENIINTPESFRMKGTDLTLVRLPLGASLAVPMNWRIDPYNFQDNLEYEPRVAVLTHGYNLVTFWKEEETSFDAVIQSLKSNNIAVSFRNDTVTINGRKWHEVVWQKKVSTGMQATGDLYFLTAYKDSMFIVALSVADNQKDFWDIGEGIVGRIIFP